MRLSHRLPQVYRAYMGAASVLKLSDHQKVFETFVLSKIMPLISFRDGDESEDSSKKLKKEILKQWRDNNETKQNFPLVHAALETILSRPGMIIRYLE